MKNRIISICLFFCLFVPGLVVYTWLQGKKAIVKKEVKWRMIEGIDQDELVLLKFTAEESKTRLNWKHSKEFEFNGEMFDIVSSEVIGDTILYWCWWDHKETMLNRHLDNLVAGVLGGDKKASENQKRAQIFYNSLFFNKLFDWHLTPIMNQQALLNNYSFQVISFSVQPPAPPPKNS